ncbi:MAG: PAS domain-containing protein [Lachnospiraceae bacterium]|nr:PAS domain-containing protein [Lachnospiraceae bacterium]
MTDREILQIYVDLAPFLATVCGTGCEIAIHDTNDPEHSLITICNSLSGREIGNPLTDLALNLVEQETYKETDYVANYTGWSKNREFLSSTYFIKNKGRLIGMLCINKDMHTAQNANQALTALMKQFNLVSAQESEFTENLDIPTVEIINTRITEIITEIGIDPAHMSRKEKILIVHRMKEEGLLMMRGAVAEIAERLYISVPTVYRYLKKDMEDQE